MKRSFLHLSALLFMAFSCGKEAPVVNTKDNLPFVKNNGTEILLRDSLQLSTFKTEVASSTELSTEIEAPGHVAALITKSGKGVTGSLVLFDNPDLSSAYTQLLQHLININQIRNVKIRQKKIELGRIVDLQKHGVATGKELLQAQTELSIEESNLANENAALIEFETSLKSEGLDPDLLRKTAAGISYLICEIPENKIDYLKEGGECKVHFTSFPDQDFKGKIEAISEMVDNISRMIKLRIKLTNSRVKTGMFATVSFGTKQVKTISLNKSSVITVQGKHYVFLKDTKGAFIRKEITIGPQIDDRITVLSGINSGEQIVINGAIQLKGLSFGY